VIVAVAFLILVATYYITQHDQRPPRT